MTLNVLLNVCFMHVFQNCGKMDLLITQMYMMSYWEDLDFFIS